MRNGLLKITGTLSLIAITTPIFANQSTVTNTSVNGSTNAPQAVTQSTANKTSTSTSVKTVTVAKDSNTVASNSSTNSVNSAIVPTASQNSPVSSPVSTSKQSTSANPNSTAHPVNSTAPIVASTSKQQDKSAAPKKTAAKSSKTPTAKKAQNDNRFSLNFENVPVDSLLKLIAKTSGLNFFVANTISSNMSIHINNVTWQEALNVVLKANGLGSRQIGTTMIIAPLKDITAYQLAEMQAKQQMELTEPLSYKIVTLKYASTADMTTLLKSQNQSLLSTRGQIGQDPRTNSLLIYDTADRLDKIASVISTLDVPAKQVMIQVRIVDLDSVFEREIGVRFGVSGQITSNGQSVGGISNNIENANAIANGQTPASVPLNFSMPATSLFTQPASVGIALTSLGDVAIDLELSAMEAENMLKVVSSPTLVTSNQKPATIEQGEEIPYLESSSSGASTIAFKNAVLKLEIVPQITPDHKIMLGIKVRQDKRGQQVITSTTDESGSSTQISTLSPPSIDTESVESSVLLNNNETVVIGGIYKELKVNSVERVPFLGSIPGLGVLFRHTIIQDDKKELLVFVTPQVIDAPPAGIHNPSSMYKG